MRCQICFGDQKSGHAPSCLGESMRIENNQRHAYALSIIEVVMQVLWEHGIKDEEEEILNAIYTKLDISR